MKDNNNIKMTKSTEKEETDMMTVFNNNPKNVINFTLQVNPERLIGRSYEELISALAKEVQNLVSIEGEKPFRMEPGTFYNVNQKATIKRAYCDGGELIVALDVPFVKTDNPTMDSFMTPNIPFDDEEEYEDVYGEEDYTYNVLDYMKDNDLTFDDLDFVLSGEVYMDYEHDDLSLVKTCKETGEIVFYCDAVDTELSIQQLLHSDIEYVKDNGTVCICPRV